MTDDCEECLAAALLVVSGIRDDLHHVLWAERAPVCGIDKAISDLCRARRQLTGGEQ